MSGLKCSEMGNWDIIVDSTAIPSEKYATQEFQNFFRQATGITLPIHETKETSFNHVYIGENSALKENNLKIDVSTLGEESFQVTVRKDFIAIVGGKPRGTLYGVYQFLEDELGIRFLTYDHTHVPDCSKLEIPFGEYTYKPPFIFRWSYYAENSKHPEFAACLRVNTVTTDEKLGGKTAQHLISHSFHLLVPFSKYGKEHPEYYALVDGVRDTNTAGAGPQPCVTNPDVIKIAAESAIRIIKEHPGIKNISVSQADTDRYCRCGRCQNINQREGSPMGSQLTFMNAVAEQVEKAYPDVKVGTLAYWFTRKPPKNVRPRHNVQIQLCSIECCTLHPIDDPNCPRNREFCRDVDEWSKICDDIWIWNYNTNFAAYDLPFPNLRSIGPNVRYFLRKKVKGVFMQANGNGTSGELSDLRNYLISRMLWNPNLDDQKLIVEFVQLHYKTAAQPILEYISMLHDNAEKLGVHPGCFPKPEEVGLNPEVARKALEYFDKALKLASDEEARARVEKASICAYRAMIKAGEPMTKDDSSLS
ncbi:DUF4838 domain-containing protein [Candidatus Bathyarchaeota archaeon]|nr:DUF4838 domain-containing protein [Candidatus Bathyarchaeota archaeon]